MRIIYTLVYLYIAKDAWQIVQSEWLSGWTKKESTKVKQGLLDHNYFKRNGAIKYANKRLLFPNSIFTLFNRNYNSYLTKGGKGPE